MFKNFIFCSTLLILFIFSGCDNNEGPFEVRIVNGKNILLSKGKPANGWVEDTITDYSTNKSVLISEINYKDGIPGNEFKLYDKKGHLLLDAKGKWIEKDLFEGTICSSLYVSGGLINSTLSDENYSMESKGTFYINRDHIVDHKGGLIDIKTLLFSGTFKDNKGTDFIKEQGTIINGQVTTYLLGQKYSVSIYRQKNGDNLTYSFYGLNDLPRGYAAFQYIVNGKLEKEIQFLREEQLTQLMNSVYNDTSVPEKDKKVDSPVNETKTDKLFNVESYLTSLKDVTDDKVQYYPSGRVKALPAYDGDYSFEDISLFPSISELIAEFEKEVKQFDKNNEDTNINGYLDSVETFIIAEKLNKNITSEDKKQIEAFEKQAKPLYEEFYRKNSI